MAAWSAAARSAYRNSQLAADVLALADAAGAEQFHLAGHDWGAARSWYMAACQLPWLPERVLGRRGGQAFRDILVRTGLDPASADRYAARARDPAVLRGPLKPSCAGVTSPGPIASPNSTAPHTGCPSRPPTRWRRCSRSTSPRCLTAAYACEPRTGNSGIHRRDLRLAEQRTTFRSLLENTTIEPSVRSINMNPQVLPIAPSAL